MATENFKEAGEIFQNAIEIEDPAKRTRYLENACKNDPKLRAEVEALLKAHEKAGDYLEVPAIDSNVTFEGPAQIEGSGTKIGRYELLEQIGEGGMGLVYQAEQKEPVKRRVALKIIKPGMDSKEVIARFEAERQALALLDHPNIAHVFDAGTTDTGRPYFVMEYVRGMSITRYCDEHRLDVEQRLRLFQEVCEGVHHAHQKGIIHRDIKPSNILISMHGDRAVPKIIDFGIAKAAVSTLTEKTMFTLQGQLLGTPEYMSPEQVDLATQDIDTRSDIYSLGVVLYELLTGVLPFERESLLKIGFAELQRTLRELEPASPSIRLTNLGQQAKAIADSRMTQVVPLARRLHRELEWIPLKAMRKDRCRRYKSASDMADDIQNYLNGNPLLAGPETAMYRVQKFVHKHAGSVATVALVSLAVIIGLAVSIMMGCRAEQARQEEVIARKQVEQALMRAEKAERIAQERAEAYRRAVYSNTLALAKVAIDKSSFSRAQKLLNSCEPDLQGWEWQHLNCISSDQSIMTYGDTDSGTRVFDIAVSPDGRRIALATNDNCTVKVLDTKTGSEVMILPHDDFPYTVAFSPDGRRIVSGSRDRTIKIWDANSGAKLKTLRGHKSWIWRVRFSPDGRRIVSGSGNGTIIVWDTDSGVKLMTLRGHKEGRIESIAFSPDSKRIVSSGEDETIRVWDANSGDEEMTINAAEGHVVFSRDGTRIISKSDDDTIKVWDVNSGAEVMTLRGHPGGVSAIALSPDGTRIASVGRRDKTIKVWDMSTGNEMSTLRGHSERVFSIVFSPDGKRIFSASYYNNEIKAWDPTPAVNRDKLRLYAGGYMANQVAFSPDGKCIAAASGKRGATGSIRLYDTHSGADIMTLLGHKAKVRSIAFSPDGRQIVSGGNNTVLRIWNVATGTVEKTLTGHEDGVNSVAFSPDGRRVVSGSDDKTIKIWNTATGDLEKTLTGDENVVYSVTFSPDGKRIVSGGNGGSLRVWDALSGTPLLTLHGHSEHVLDVSVSSDGERIASCGQDKTIRIWDANTGEALMTLRGHELVVWTVAFSPDGRRIVSGGHNGEVKIWDAETAGHALLTLDGDSINIKSAVFSPDGRSICVGGRGDYGCITLWESVNPAAGYEGRQIANSARGLLDELYKKHDFYYNAISELEDDDTINDSVRRVALQIANARLWEDVQELHSQSWPVVFSPDNDEMKYQEALKKVERAISMGPDGRNLMTTLGAAQYRVGAYEDALATLERLQKTRDDPTIELVIDGGFIRAMAFRAMALKQLGRGKEANVVIQKLRGHYERWFRFHRNHPFSFTRFVEVEKLFAGEDSTLLSIWDLIEENKLDEASELVEEARLSKNADYVSRMEGAVKLLEVLRNLK